MRIKYQQGDVLLKEVKSYGIKIDESKLKKLDHLILAEGEATGHKHEIISGIAFLAVTGNDTILKVLSDYAKLRHDEHQEIDVPKGDYKIEIVKEYDEIEERRVMD